MLRGAEVGIPVRLTIILEPLYIKRYREWYCNVSISTQTGDGNSAQGTYSKVKEKQRKLTTKAKMISRNTLRTNLVTPTGE